MFFGCSLLCIIVSEGMQSYLFCEVNNFANLILVSDGHGQVAAIALVSNEHMPSLEGSPFQHKDQ